MIGQNAINIPSIRKSKKSFMSYNIPNLSQIVIPNNGYAIIDKTIKIYNTIIILLINLLFIILAINFYSITTFRIFF